MYVVLLCILQINKEMEQKHDTRCKENQFLSLPSLFNLWILIFYFKQLIFDWWNKHFISDDDSKILNSVLYHKQCYIVLGSLQNMEFL